MKKIAPYDMSDNPSTSSNERKPSLTELLDKMDSKLVNMKNFVKALLILYYNKVGVIDDVYDDIAIRQLEALFFVLMDKYKLQIDSGVLRPSELLIGFLNYYYTNFESRFVLYHKHTIPMKLDTIILQLFMIYALKIKTHDLDTYIGKKHLPRPELLQEPHDWINTRNKEWADLLQKTQDVSLRLLNEDPFVFNRLRRIDERLTLRMNMKAADESNLLYQLEQKNAAIALLDNSPELTKQPHLKKYLEDKMNEKTVLENRLRTIMETREKAIRRLAELDAEDVRVGKIRNEMEKRELLPLVGTEEYDEMFPREPYPVEATSIDNREFLKKIFEKNEVQDEPVDKEEQELKDINEWYNRRKPPASSRLIFPVPPLGIDLQNVFDDDDEDFLNTPTPILPPSPPSKESSKSPSKKRKLGGNRLTRNRFTRRTHSQRKSRSKKYNKKTVKSK